MIIFCSLKYPRHTAHTNKCTRSFLAEWYFHLLPWKMMRVNEAKQTLVNFSEMEFISGLPYFWHNCNCFCFPVGVSDVVAAVVRFFFRSFKRFVCGVRFLLHLRQQSVAICCFRFTDFIDSFFYRLPLSLPLSPSISGITHKRAHICQFTSVRATAKWWIVHFIIIWCAQEFIYAKPEMSENAW